MEKHRKQKENENLRNSKKLLPGRTSSVIIRSKKREIETETDSKNRKYSNLIVLSMSEMIPSVMMRSTKQLLGSDTQAVANLDSCFDHSCTEYPICVYYKFFLLYFIYEFCSSVFGIRIIQFRSGFQGISTPYFFFFSSLTLLKLRTISYFARFGCNFLLFLFHVQFFPTILFFIFILSGHLPITPLPPDHSIMHNN